MINLSSESEGETKGYTNNGEKIEKEVSARELDGQKKGQNRKETRRRRVSEGSRPRQAGCSAKKGKTCYNMHWLG